MPAAMPFSPVFKKVSVTPTIDTAIYANNDQLGSLMQFPGLLGPGRSGQIVFTSILDKSSQSAAITIFLFSSQPTIASTDNAALNISDTEMQKCCGIITMTSAYASTSANSINSTPLASLVQQAVYAYSDQSDGTIWAIMKSGGTPTYGAASDLIVTLGALLYQDVVTLY